MFTASSRRAAFQESSSPWVLPLDTMVPEASAQYSTGTVSSRSAS